MLFIPILTVLLSQGLAASSYVVMEEDGYYRSWRSNSKAAEMNQWQPFAAPQMYFPFLQNFNPFSWWQPQPPQQPTIQQEDPDVKLIRDRQDAIFDILKCMVEEEMKDVCKRMLGNAMRLFPEHQTITNKPQLNQPILLQISTSFDVEPKPLESSPEMLPTKPLMLEKLPEIEITLIQPSAETEVSVESIPSETEITVTLSKPMETELETKPLDEPLALETVPIKDQPEVLPVKIEIPEDPVRAELEPMPSANNSVEGQPPAKEATLAENDPAAVLP